MNSSDDIPPSDPHRNQRKAAEKFESGEAKGVESEAASASNARKQIRLLRGLVTAAALILVVFFMVIIAVPLFAGIGLPKPGLETYFYIISGVAPVVAITTIVAMLLLGVFRGFHGKDMDDGLGMTAIKEALKGAGANGG